jgi:two-component system chemotaxis response regulator CheY
VASPGGRRAKLRVRATAAGSTVRKFGRRWVGPGVNRKLVSHPTISGFRALVVDDSRAARQVLVSALALLGPAVCDEASDGAEGLKRFAAADYDLVVTDIHMPLLDGLKLIHHIRSGVRRPTTPILVVTTDRATSERDRALQVGANAFLSKPVEPGQVSRAAASLLGRPKG